MSDCGKYPYEGPIMNEANWFTNETTKLLAENLAHRSRLDELERENAVLRQTLDTAIVLLRKWNKNDVTDDVVIDTRKAIYATLKEAQP